MSRSGIIWLFILIAVLLTLLFSAALQKSFWEDETLTASTAEGGLTRISTLAKNDMHPPLMYLTAYYWGGVFGYSELGLRSFSILFAVLSLIMVYFFSLQAFDQRTAIISIALLAISPFYIMYAHNARYYSFAAFLTVTAAYGVYRFASTNKFVYLIIYIAACTVLLYLIFLSLSVFLACIIWWFIHWQQKDTRKVNDVIYWLLAQVVVLVLFSLGMRYILNAYQNFPNTLEFQNLVIDSINRFAYFSYSFSIGETISPTNPIAWVGLMVSAFTAIFALWINRKEINFWLPVTMVVMIFIFNLLASMHTSLVSTWQNISYRSLYALPFFLILLSSGFSKMKPKVGLTLTAALLLVYAVGLFNYFSNNQFIRPMFTVNWHEIMQDIDYNARPDAVVICNRGDSACVYYSNQYGFDTYRPEKWVDIKGTSPSEVYWVQTNLIREIKHESQEKKIIASVSDVYSHSEVQHYAPQDPAIRSFKSKFLNAREYEYRVDVFRFFNP